MVNISKTLLGAAALLSLPFALACGEPMDGGATGGAPGTGGASSTGAVSGAGGGTASCAASVSAAVINNLVFESHIALPSVTVAPRSLPTFDWSAVNTNFLGHPIVAGSKTEMNSMVLLVWGIPVDTIAEMINKDDPTIDQQVKFSIQLAVDPSKTSASITEFTAFGQPVTEQQIQDFLDPTLNDPATTTFTLMGQQGTELGHHVQMIQAFTVDPVSQSTSVVMTNNSTGLNFDASLPGGKFVAGVKTAMPPGVPGVMMDWSTIPTNSYQSPFINNQITEVLVGRYSKSIAEIETDFLQLEYIADDIWRGQVTVGTSLDLSTMTHEVSGAPFPGVTDDGSTWLVALLCTDCINPTPWYVSPIQTCQ